MRRLSALIAILLTASGSAFAQSMPPSGQFRSMIEAGKDQWVAFRNFNGRQLIYFTHFVAMKCGIDEVRYSLNSDDLSKTWPLPECNVHIPFHVDPEADQLYLDLPPATVESVTVRVFFTDGGGSAIRTYGQCSVDGDITCGVLLSEEDAVLPNAAQSGKSTAD